MAAIAVRSSTRAVASFSRLSPSSTATTRPRMPTRFTIDVATASVGLTIAPSAMPHQMPRPGITQAKKNPSTIDEMTTSATDSPPMALNSRRKFMVGIETEAE